MSELSIGMIGLGVMGRNLSLNMEDHGFSVAAYDAWPEPVDRFVAEAKGRKIEGFKELAAFVKSLRRPRRIIMLVKAGEVVDKTIAALRPLLEPGDMLVDAGNEYYKNTERRTKELEGAGIRYFGMGVSGGEMGARHGPSLMPGGDKAAYEELAPVFTKIAAQHPDGPCVTYIGPGGSGHYVKMVHNGIEYGDMQLIAEAYDVLKSIGGLSNEELAQVFDQWNQVELKSYLVEITAKIFRKKDPEGKGYLVDNILDATGMKGTGKWTVEDAAELAVPVTTIATSLEARELAAGKVDRVKASKLLPGPQPSASAADKKQLVDDVRKALYAAKACSYAQGMNLLRVASETHGWSLKLGELARIWQDGCIIRAQFLGRIKAAYDRDPNLSNLLLDPSFREELAARQEGWRNVVALAAKSGVPMISTMGSLGYYDSVRRERLPANLTQAQRDFFGAHTYKRIDGKGEDIHTDWLA
ncbi:MAG TPA: decarboxylating NADP(+)-dependent phosphogluconate dehydrogenase [Minicystis sp.]|nr:decarboxylating NADP(+)-dependent phosphogluconate dehydrogenase [Minicystis sp.]